MNTYFTTTILGLFFASSICESQFVPATMWRKKGNGYFVQTSAGTTGNLGGLAGADEFCLTDLQTYDWKGKAEAGTLTSSRVKAFLCDDTTCINPLPNTTYFFATSDYPTHGGASFTTDSNGRGPNDTNNWDAITHFGGAWYYWSGDRGNTSSTLWGTAPMASGNSCSNWTAGASSDGGLGGAPTYQDGYRWNDSQLTACNQNFGLICMVHPQ